MLWGNCQCCQARPRCNGCDSWWLCDGRCRKRSCSFSCFCRKHFESGGDLFVLAVAVVHWKLRTATIVRLYLGDWKHVLRPPCPRWWSQLLWLYLGPHTFKDNCLYKSWNNINICTGSCFHALFIRSQQHHDHHHHHPHCQSYHITIIIISMTNNNNSNEEILSFHRS